MKISINDQSHEINYALNVQELLTQLVQTETRGVAVAINDKVISRTCWQQTYCQDGDNVLIIKACSGG